MPSSTSGVCRILVALVAPGTATVLDLFFPIAPSPSEVRIEYADASSQHSIALDTADALAGLHLVPAGG